MMVTCQGEVHLWSLRNQAILPDNDVGCFVYHEKNDGSDVSYPQEKASFAESRDSTWTVKNKRPEKLRDNIKELEDILQTYKCVRAKWLSRKLLQVFMSNGSMVTCVISSHTGDVDRIFIDKSLTSKLSGEVINDALLTDSYMVVSYADKPKIDYIYFEKRLPTPDSIKKLEKLTAFNPKISQIDLPGPRGRKLDRRLASSQHQNLILVWWSTASDEAWPWAPMISEEERANMVLFSTNGIKLAMACFGRTVCDPIYAAFSLNQPNQLFVVEKAGVAGGESSVDLSNYEYRNKLLRTSEITLPLSSPVISCDRTPAEDLVLLGCQDGTIVMFDDNKHIKRTIHASVNPHIIQWHPSGTLVLVTSQKGEIQVFDLALNPLKIQLKSEKEKGSNTLNMASLFRSVPLLDKMVWCPAPDDTDYVADCIDPVLLVFDKGPVGVLQFQLGVIGQGHLGPLQLVNEYLKYKQVDEAINLLNGLNWNVDGQDCFACLNTIMIDLLKRPLTPDREGQLEATLGAFYAPAKPLTETAVLAYRDPIMRLARRFFHHLLRYSRFDKAYLLAVDIGAKDLFMDIHYIAQDKGELALAEVAKRKANQLEAEELGVGGVNGYEEVVGSDNEDYIEGLVDDDSEEDMSPGSRALRGYQHRTSRNQVSSIPNDPRPGHHHRSQDRQSLPQYMESADTTLRQLELQLSSQFIDSDFTRILGHQNLTGNQQRASSDQSDERSEDLKVVHFAMV